MDKEPPRPTQLDLFKVELKESTTPKLTRTKKAAPNRHQRDGEYQLKKGHDTFIQKAYGGNEAKIHTQDFNEWRERRDEADLHESLGLG